MVCLRALAMAQFGGIGEGMELSTAANVDIDFLTRTCYIILPPKVRQMILSDPVPPILLPLVFVLR